MLSSVFCSFGLLQPFSPVFRPASEEQESEGGAPIRPALYEIPHRLADDGTHERGPKAPEGHPEERGADGFQEDEHRECDIHEADAEQQRGRDVHIGNAEEGKPLHPRFLALQREDAVAEELTSDGNAQDPLDACGGHVCSVPRLVVLGQLNSNACDPATEGMAVVDTLC